mgnify:CR=1 FL=1
MTLVCQTCVSFCEDGTRWDAASKTCQITGVEGMLNLFFYLLFDAAQRLFIICFSICCLLMLVVLLLVVVLLLIL